MKKIVLNLFRIFFICFISLSIFIFLLLVYRSIEQQGFSDKMYATKDEANIAYIIQKIFDEFNSPKCDRIVKNLYLNLELKDINYFCISPSIYTIKTKYLLEKINIDYKYASLVDRKKTLYGESGSAFIMVTSDNHVIPVFTSLYKVNTNISLSDANCIKIKNNKLHILIKSELNNKLKMIIK